MNSLTFVFRLDCHIFVDSIESLFYEDYAEHNNGFFDENSDYCISEQAAIFGEQNNGFFDENSDYFISEQAAIITPVTSESCATEHELRKPKKSFLKRMNIAINRMFFSKV